VALSVGAPFSGGVGVYRYPGSGPIGIFVDGQDGDQLPAGQFVYGNRVTPDYFSSLGIRLLKGRDFEPGDLNASRVAIVSEGFARRFISGDALGKTFRTYMSDDRRYPWMEIVGVVNDVRDHAMKPSPAPAYYMPFAFDYSGRFEIIAQTSGMPMHLVPAIARVVQSVDKDARMMSLETVDQVLSDSAAEPRFQTALVGSFGLLGLILAIVGVYGVISYSVVQKTHEIGVRMALGAGRRDVLRMILREGMVLAVAGIAIGTAGALALTRVLRSMLFEIEPTDPATLAGVAIFLAIAALAACYLPARRATRVDPMLALRSE
jgi:putative ABC transport system permease protein